MSEEQANKIMADIVWFSTDKEIWGGILSHLYDLHKLRDLQFECDTYQLIGKIRDVTEYSKTYLTFRSMHYGD